jgi:hypothetical protein
MRAGLDPQVEVVLKTVSDMVSCSPFVAVIVSQIGSFIIMCVLGVSRSLVPRGASQDGDSLDLFFPLSSAPKVQQD